MDEVVHSNEIEGIHSVDPASKQNAIEEAHAHIRELESRLSERECAALFYAVQMHLFDAFGETRMDRLTEYLGVTRPTARKTVLAFCEANLLHKVSARPAAYRLTEGGLEALGISDRP